VARNTKQHEEIYTRIPEMSAEQSVIQKKVEELHLLGIPQGL